MVDLSDAAADLSEAVVQATDGTVRLHDDHLKAVVSLLAHGTEGGETFDAFRSVFEPSATPAPSKDERSALSAVLRRVEVAIAESNCGLQVEADPRHDLVVSWPLDWRHPQPFGVPVSVSLSASDANVNTPGASPVPPSIEPREQTDADRA